MRRRAMETAGTPTSTFSPAALRSVQSVCRSIYPQNAASFPALRRKGAKTAGTPASTFPGCAPIRTERVPRHLLAERRVFSHFAKKRSENSWNASFDVSRLRSNPHRAVRRSLYSQNAASFPALRRKGAKTAGTPASTFPGCAPIRTEPSDVPSTRRTLRLSPLCEEKERKQLERQLRRYFSLCSNPRRACAISPACQNGTSFPALRRKDAKTAGKPASMFSSAVSRLLSSLRKRGV